MPRNLVFVYGSLRRGSAASMPVRFPAAKFIDNGKVRGRLYDLGEYPAAWLGEKTDAYIFGEAYEVNEETLLALDEFEAASGYHRRPVEIVTGKQSYSGWTYAPHPETIVDRDVIPSGDWLSISVRRSAKSL